MNELIKCPPWQLSPQLEFESDTETEFQHGHHEGLRHPLQGLRVRISISRGHVMLCHQTNLVVSESNRGENL